jgi:two-component system response regulator YesN
MIGGCIMYKLLIADDEQVIREGLYDIVNWSSMGFQTIGACEDGQQVIDYLEKDIVDVIVTDIKMNKKSGLDIAKYVYEKKLPVKIILISGYREVDLAMSAIEYNVKKYIMKPIDIDVLTDAMSELKSVLDKEAKVQQNNISLEAVKKGIEDLKDDFLEELLIGSFKNYKYVVSMFHFLYPSLNIEKTICFIATLVIENNSDLAANNPAHNRSELYTCLQNCIHLSSSIVDYRMITKSDNYVQLLGIVLSPVERNQADVMIHAANEKLCNDLNDILNIHSIIEELDVYTNISEVMYSKSSNHQKKGMDESLMLKIREQMKMIYSAILSGNTDASDNLVRKLIEYFTNLDLATIRSLITDMFTEINKRFRELSLMIFDYSESGIEGQLHLMNSIDEIEDFLALSIRRLTGIISEAQHNEGNIIEQAKRYITKHITEDISLEDISDVFYISQCHFSRIFKNQAGENFIDFVVRKKMDYAATLMRNPKLKIYEIGSMVGYKNNHYFCKVFKIHTGYSPSAYRKLF